MNGNGQGELFGSGGQDRRGRRCPTCGRPIPRKPDNERAKKKRTLEQALEIISRGLPPHWHHRFDDPSSSAESSTRSHKFKPSHAARVLAALIYEGREAHVVRLAELTGLGQYATSKRLSDLKNHELVYGTGRFVETAGGRGKAEIYRTAVEAPSG